MDKKFESRVSDENEFKNIISDLIQNDTVQKMKLYRQHYDTDCFEHCYMVAYYCYKLCKKFNLDYISATRAAMVHDLFLYDWREPSKTHMWHAFTHGKVACEKAKEFMELNDMQQDMIKNHMWPVTPKLPKYKETWIITLADKYSAIIESKEGFQKQVVKSKVFRYAMMFLFVFLFGNYRL